MNAILLALAVLSGPLGSVKPREFCTALALCAGDPLGSPADGNVELLATAEIIVPNERSATAVCGRPAPLATVEVTAIALRDGGLWVEVIGTRGAPGPVPAAPPVRVTRLATPGERFRVRLAADSPESQTWIEVTVIEVAKKAANGPLQPGQDR